MQKLIYLLIIPTLAFAPPNKVEIKQKLEYSEHIRQKLNAILEIPEGRNYWEKEFKTIIYENTLKQYFENGN